MLLLLMASALLAQSNSIQSCTRREKRRKKKPGNSIDPGAILFLPGLPPKNHKNTVTTNPKNVLINKVSASNGCKINVYRKGVIPFFVG
jgi:hypothetical protein